jgi:hypothetical protein
MATGVPVPGLPGFHSRRRTSPALGEGRDMGLFGWMKQRGGSRDDRALAAWRNLWHTAATAFDATQVEALRAGLTALERPAEEIEIEQEMLDALQDLGALSATIAASGLPAIQTGHRVVGLERCHFTAPASMPDAEAQPSGRLFLTSGRAIFAGGSGAAVPWHQVAEARHLDRDLVLLRSDRDQLYRFRCNSFSDALRAAYIARELLAARRRPRL